MSITLTSEQLYRCAYETPIDTLRKEFGISRHKMKPPPPLPKATNASKLTIFTTEEERFQMGRLILLLLVVFLVLLVARVLRGKWPRS